MITYDRHPNGQPHLPNFYVCWRTSPFSYRQYQRFRKFLQRDIYHQRWLCQWRPRNRHRQEVGVIVGSLSGTFTPSGGETFDMGGYITPGPASSEGSFGISGTANFGTSCFGSGNIGAGTFPSGSFMIGTSVVLAIQTNNGTFIFVGTDTDHGGADAVNALVLICAGAARSLRGLWS